MTPLIIQLVCMPQQKSNEVMAHAYSHLFEIPTTGLRFFTVYGPWGDLIWLYLPLLNLFLKISQ